MERHSLYLIDEEDLEEVRGFVSVGESKVMVAAKEFESVSLDNLQPLLRHCYECLTSKYVAWIYIERRTNSV